MSITNITASLSNGVRVVTTAQVKAAGVVASCIDESMTLNIDSAITANNTTRSKIEITSSVVKINDRDYALSYGTGNLDTNSEVNVVDSMLHWNLTTARKNIRFTKFKGSVLRSTKTGTGGLAFVYTQAGNKAVLEDSVFDGIYCHEVSGVPLTFSGVLYKNCGINLLNWEAGDLTINGTSFGSGTLTATAYTGADGGNYTTYDAWLGAGNPGNRFRFVDCTINLSKIAINLTPAAGSELCFKSFTRNEKYVLDGVSLSGAQVQFTPAASSGSSSQAAFTRSVTSNGYLSDGVTEYIGTELLVQSTVDSGTTRSSGLADPATIRNFTLKNVTWTRRIRRADINEVVMDVTPAAAVGKVSDPSLVNHVRDQSFTGTYSQAAAITGVAFSYNSSTGNVSVTVTEARTVQEIYNAWKSWSSQIAQFGISQTKLTMSSGFLTVIGTLTISGAGAVSGVWTDNTGTRVEMNVSINQAGGRLYITDNNGNEVYNSVVAGTSVKLYYPPGSSGVWNGAVELYGYKRSTFIIDVTGGGVDNLTVVMVPDSTVVAAQSVAAAYTSLDTIQKLRDWIANYNQTAAGIRAPITALLSSGILNIGSASLTCVGSLGYASGTITLNAATLTGDIQTTGVVNGDVTGTIYSATVIRGTTGVWNPSLNGVTLRFTTAGTYDLRTASIKNTLTLTNTSGGAVTAQPPASATVVNSGPSITLDYRERLVVASADGLGLSSLIMVNGAIYGGNPIAGWVYNQTSRNVDVNSTDNVSIYVHSYGYKPKIISGKGAFAAASNITMIPEYIDTSLDTAVRDELSTHFSAGIDAQSSVFLAVNIDMSQYAPEVVLNALHFYLVKLGYMAAAGCLVAGTVGNFKFIDGGLVLNTNKFYGKIADSITTLPDTGIYLPIYVEVDPAVTAADPTFKPVKKNNSGLLLSYALWTKQAAALTLSDRVATATIVRGQILPDIQAIQPGASLNDIRTDLATVEKRIVASIG